MERNYTTTSTTFPNWFHANSCEEHTGIYEMCISHAGRAGARDINICAKMSRSSEAAATPSSFVVATDVLKGHLWWGGSSCNDFQHWRAGKHMKGVVGSGKAANTQACCYGLSLFGMPGINGWPQLYSVVISVNSNQCQVYTWWCYTSVLDIWHCFFSLTATHQVNSSPLHETDRSISFSHRKPMIRCSNSII